MIATFIFSVGLLGMGHVFLFASKSVANTRARTVAASLAENQLATFKGMPYHRVIVTTAPVSHPSFCPDIVYDSGYYPPGKMDVGGLSLDYRMLVRKVNEGPSGSLEYKNWNDPDTGLKEVLVSVLWDRGGSCQQVQLRSLIDDPNRVQRNSGFSGTVKESGTFDPIEGATVLAVENPDFRAITDLFGSYSFSTTPGTYTLRASSAGYFSMTLAAQDVDVGEINSEQSFALTKMTSGTISGSAFLRDHLVISQVVASTEVVVDGNNLNEEYVELYNPTTWTWTIEDATFNLRYVNQFNIITDIPLNFVQDSISPGAYYLIANTSPVKVDGETIEADAVYTSAGDDVILTVGGIQITDGTGIKIFDRVGWTQDHENPFTAPSAAVEGSPVLLDGLEEGEQIVRSSEPFASIDPASGTHAWDSNNNSVDFNQGPSPQNQNLTYPPHNSSTLVPPKGGTPAQGAVVFSEDPLSDMTFVDANGLFMLTNVATGTWRVYVSSGLVGATTGYYGGYISGFSTQTPAIILNTQVADGYIAGRVTDVFDIPLEDILVDADGNQGTTDSEGRYWIVAPPGMVDVVANFGHANPLYIQEAQNGIEVTQGEMTDGIDFYLPRGGGLAAWVTTNGVDPLPGIPVLALEAGIEGGSGMSGSDGYVLMKSLPVGTYQVQPLMELGESVVPSIYTATVLGGDTVFVGTFTVVSALSYVTGNLTSGGSSGPPIRTGVLIYATTGTIEGSLPALDSSVQFAPELYYATTSDSDGSYKVAVAGGYTYNVYAWYTWWDGGISTTEKKSAVIDVPSETTQSLNFFW